MNVTESVTPVSAKELIEAFLSGDNRQIQMITCVILTKLKSDPGFMENYIPRLINQLKLKGCSNALKRNSLRILSNLKIPPNVEAELYDITYTFLINRYEQVAIRCFSMKLMQEIVRNHPDLKNELKILIETEIDFCSKPAFISRASKTLKYLNCNYQI